MNAYFKNYRGAGQMCIIAKDEETLRALKDRGGDILYISNNQLTLYPQNDTYPIDSIPMGKLSLLRNYDIIDIHPSGVIYRMFGNEEPDTTLFMGGGCNSNCVMCPASDNERKHAYAYPPEQLLQYINYSNFP